MAAAPAVRDPPRAGAKHVRRYTSIVVTACPMSTLAIDTFKLLTALRATGKSANFSAEEIANAIRAAQEGAELLTMSVFEARMAAFEARMVAFEARMDAFDVKLDARLEALRADIKAEVKTSQVQSLLWLSGIMLVSNGAVIAMLARATRLF
jgi:hypothetical protein